MKKFLTILPIFLVVTFIPQQAHAAGFLNTAIDFVVGLFSKSPFEELCDNIVKLAQLINDSTAQMMKFGDMLMCSGLHGSAADVDILGIVSLKLIAPSIFLSGLILYVIGFLIMLMTSFYLFDAAFNLSISVILLPLVLALWPFGWTRDKLQIVIKSIAYYIGIFIFLPLGILIAQMLAFTVVEQAFVSSTEFSFMEAYAQDQADLIEDNLGIFCITFLKVLLFYTVAIRIIPLLAQDYCNYFFGQALAGNPMLSQISNMGKKMLKQGKKVGKLGKDIAKHQTGKAIEGKGNKMGGFIGKAVAQYGKNMARTGRGR